jgi:hypothetical protein
MGPNHVTLARFSAAFGSGDVDAIMTSRKAARSNSTASPILEGVSTSTEPSRCMSESSWSSR